MISYELIGWPFAHLCVMLCKANILELHAAVLGIVVVTTTTACEKMCIRNRPLWNRAIVGILAE